MILSDLDTKLSICPTTQIEGEQRNSAILLLIIHGGKQSHTELSEAISQLVDAFPEHLREFYPITICLARFLCSSRLARHTARVKFVRFA